MPGAWVPWIGGIISQTVGADYTVVNKTTPLHWMHDGIVEFGVMRSGSDVVMVANGVGNNFNASFAGMNVNSGVKMFGGLMSNARSCNAKITCSY